MNRVHIYTCTCVCMRVSGRVYHVGDAVHLPVCVCVYGSRLLTSLVVMCTGQLGREEPAISMDASGKIVWARHNEIQTANANIRSGAGAAPYTYTHMYTVC
jgi:hypothetical protein